MIFETEEEKLKFDGEYCHKEFKEESWYEELNAEFDRDRRFSE